MNKKISATVLLIISIVIAVAAGKNFVKMREPEPIYPGAGVKEVKMLSDYFPDLKGTMGDTEIYVMEGSKPGGKMMVLGATHPNEPAAMLAAITLIENANIEAGTVYVIPRANNSALSHNDAQEASPQFIHVDTEGGQRWFRFGSRATNPIDQWPDPDVYIHASSGQHLSGSETRNLNRGYPGRKDGSFTEKVCYGITKFIKDENIDVSIDLHEASPEYPVINAMVSHENAMGVASAASINLQLNGIQISLEQSPKNLRGLTHRELGDFTDTLAILMETANASQGRLRGKTDEELAITGKDKFYVKAAELGRLYVPYDDNGHPIEERVGRHINGVNEIAKAYTMQNEANPIIINNIPEYSEILSNGLGNYLNAPQSN
ncbi:MAG: succinylglutamate desuccinylase [Tissierellia bacterium]|nr:succinylglutamate desuccinylase [Tissierellia bacterium]